MRNWGNKRNTRYRSSKQLKYMWRGRKLLLLLLLLTFTRVGFFERITQQQQLDRSKSWLHPCLLLLQLEQKSCYFISWCIALTWKGMLWEETRSTKKSFSFHNNNRGHNPCHLSCHLITEQEQQLALLFLLLSESGGKKYINWIIISS